MLDKNHRMAFAFSNVGHACSHFFMLVYPTVVLALEGMFDQPYHHLIGLMLVGNILYGAIALPAGYLGDRWSAPGMMVVFFIGTGGASILTGFARTEFEIAAGLALIGFFGAIYHPVGIAWVARQVTKRGKALGWNGVFGGLGVAAAPLVAGALTDFWSWRAAFILPGVLALFAGLVLWVAAALGWLAEDVSYRARARPEASRSDMRRGAFVLVLTVMCTGLVYQATSFAMPKLFETRLSEMLGGGLIGVGGLVSLVYLFASATQLLGGWLADRFEVKTVYLMCWIVQVPLLLLAASIDGLLLAPAVIAMVMANTISTPAENSLFARYTPPRWRATAFGVKFLLSLGVAALAIPLIAWIYAASGGFYWLLAILAGFAAIAAAGAALLPGGRPKSPLQSSAQSSAHRPATNLGTPSIEAAD